MDVKSAFLYGTIDEEVFVENLKRNTYFLRFTHEWEISSRNSDIQMLDHQILPRTRRILREKTELEEMHQVTPKECHLHAVKRIFRYLKGHPKLGLWYPKESPFDLVAYSDSDYGDLLTKPFDAGRFQYLVGEGLGTPTEPHHTPSPEAYPTSHTTHSSPTLPPVTPASIPTVTPSETTPLRQYTRRARIAQSSALPPVADELSSPLRDVSEGVACPTHSGLGADQDKANIAKTSTLPHDSVPRVIS
nr:putative ribonuclease H-like domain-containing protein [Tanacetum cinerariifolium]